MEAPARRRKRDRPSSHPRHDDRPIVIRRSACGKLFHRLDQGVEQGLGLESAVFQHQVETVGTEEPADSVAKGA
jgi:hypothetical protein